MQQTVYCNKNNIFFFNFNFTRTVFDNKLLFILDLEKDCSSDKTFE
jgi:hypothetical protein